MTRWGYGLLSAGLFCGVPSGISWAQADQQQCRDSVFTTQDGRQTNVRYCKDADGSWRRVGGTDLPPPPLPARSEITYQGTFAATVKQPGRPIRRLDLNSILNSGGTSQDMQGTLTLTLSFDGGTVRGRASGTGGVRAAALTGVFANGRCRLVTSDQTMIYEGTCGQKGFNGQMSSSETSRTNVSGTFKTTASNLVDVAQRDRDRAAAAADAQARAQAAAAAEARRLAALRSRAEAGDVEAMKELADEYASSDAEAAAQWWARAASRGDLWSSYSLAVAYARGAGVPESLARSFEYRLQCAKAPAARAIKFADGTDVISSCMYIVALQYYDGHGVIRNETEGVRWFRQCAARQNDECIAWLNDHGVR